MLAEGHRSGVGNQRVTSDDLIEMSSETTARTFTIAAPMLDRKDTAILGRLSNVQCHSGLYVHATDTIEAHDLSTEWDKPAACSVAIMLEGELDAFLDDVPLHLGRKTDEIERGPTGHIWALTKTTRLIRRSRKGMRVRKVIVTVPPEWIERVMEGNVLPNENLDQFMRTHRANRSWTPSAHAIALVLVVIAVGAAFVVADAFD